MSLRKQKKEKIIQAKRRRLQDGPTATLNQLNESSDLEEDYVECPLFCVRNQDYDSLESEKPSIPDILYRHVPQIFTEEECKTEEEKIQVSSFLRN